MAFKLVILAQNGDPNQHSGDAAAATAAAAAAAAAAVAGSR